MKDIVIIDEIVAEERRAAAHAVAIAVLSGLCNPCPYYAQCTTDDNFAFPANAACMILKAQMQQDSEKADA